MIRQPADARKGRLPVPASLAAFPVLAPNWFKDTFLGIEIEQFIGLGIIALATVVLHIALLGLRALYIRQHSDPSNQEFWHLESKRLNRSLFMLAAAVAILVGIPLLDFEQDIEDFGNFVGQLLGVIAIVVLAFQAIDIFTDYLRRRADATATRLDDQLVPMIRMVLRIFVLIVGVLFALQNLDVNVGSLLAGLGIGGLAVALAAQDTIKNLLGGATIFADKPFQVGDWVLIGDLEGTVERVGFRSTRVRTFADSLITVPNARISDTAIDNMGLRTWRRYSTTLGIAYHTDPDRVQAFVEGIRAIIQANPHTRKDYYLVEFHSYGASSLNIMVYCFFGVPDWNAELRARHVLNLDIMRLAKELQVDFAFPTQTLHLVETPEHPQQFTPLASQEQLASTVDAFGPGGASGQREDRPLSDGHNPGS